MQALRAVGAVQHHIAAVGKGQTVTMDSSYATVHEMGITKEPKLRFLTSKMRNMAIIMQGPSDNAEQV